MYIGSLVHLHVFKFQTVLIRDNLSLENFHSVVINKMTKLEQPRSICMGKETIVLLSVGAAWLDTHHLVLGSVLTCSLLCPYLAVGPSLLVL